MLGSRLALLQRVGAARVVGGEVGEGGFQVFMSHLEHFLQLQHSQQGQWYHTARCAVAQSALGGDSRWHARCLHAQQTQVEEDEDCLQDASHSREPASALPSSSNHTPLPGRSQSSKPRPSRMRTLNGEGLGAAPALHVVGSPITVETVEPATVAGPSQRNERGSVATAPVPASASQGSQQTAASLRQRRSKGPKLAPHAKDVDGVDHKNRRLQQQSRADVQEDRVDLLNGDAHPSGISSEHVPHIQLGNAERTGNDGEAEAHPLTSSADGGPASQNAPKSSQRSEPWRKGQRPAKASQSDEASSSESRPPAKPKHSTPAPPAAWLSPAAIQRLRNPDTSTDSPTVPFTDVDLAEAQASRELHEKFSRAVAAKDWPAFLALYKANKSAINHKHVGKIVFGLKNMRRAAVSEVQLAGIRDSGMMAHLSEVLKNTLHYISLGQLTMILFSLGACQTWHENTIFTVEEDVLEGLKNRAIVVLSRNDYQYAKLAHIPRLLWACDKLHLQPSTDQLRQLAKAMDRRCGYGNGIDVAHVLWGFAQFSFPLDQTRVDSWLGAVMHNSNTASQALRFDANSASRLLSALGYYEFQPPQEVFEACMQGLMEDKENWIPRVLAHAVHACGKLGLKPEQEVIDEMVHFTLRHMHDSSEVTGWSPSRVAAFCWGLAKLRPHSVNHVDLRLLVESVNIHVAATSRHVKAADISRILWAMAKLGVDPGNDLLANFVEAATAQFDCCESRAITELLHALHGLGCVPEKLLLDQVEHVVLSRPHIFSPGQKADLSGIFDRLGYQPDAEARAILAES